MGEIIAISGRIVGLDYTMTFILLAVAAVCAVVAQSIMTPKGYSARLGFCLGLFLGVIGIIIAAVMPDKNAKRSNTNDAAVDADTLLKYKQLLDSGAITQDEFDAMKRKLISGRMD